MITDTFYKILQVTQMTIKEEQVVSKCTVECIRSLKSTSKNSQVFRSNMKRNKTTRKAQINKRYKKCV